jgi:hypothetical protein
VDLLFSCWLLTGQRLYVGVGSGRKRLNILGAYCPDGHDGYTVADPVLPSMKYDGWCSP